MRTYPSRQQGAALVRELTRVVSREQRLYENLSESSAGSSACTGTYLSRQQGAALV